MQKKTNKSWLDSLALILNVIALIPLFGSYLAPYINPSSSWHIAFLGLTYPIWLIIHVAFVIYWITRFNKYVLISLIALLIGINQIKHNFQLFQFQKITEDSTAFKVMSYNVRNFDLYNYTHDWKIQHTKRIKIMEFVNQEQPDILCIQEFVNLPKNEFPTLDTLNILLKNPSHHIYYTSKHSRNHFGIATFSKYPIINRDKIDFLNSDGNNICIFTDILINSDTIRVYNIHLQSVHFERPDYQFAQEITEGMIQKDTVSSKTKAIRMIRSLKKAFIKRAVQSQLISNHIQSCPYKVIVCGDFNDTPSSYSYHQISKQLLDGFNESGMGVGETYNGVFPLLRIDYILYSKEMQAFQYKKHKINFSDHHPISCKINLQTMLNE